MKSWNVNWDTKHFEIIFDDETLVFICLSCDAKVIHEFIGGYIFLSLRSKEKPESFNDEMFYKLTEKR
jgi:kindlin 2